MHRTVAEALIAGHDPDPEAPAYHFRQAGDPRATDWLIAAGWKARRAFAWTTAAQHFDAALSLLVHESADDRQRQCAWLYYITAYVYIYSNRQRSLAYNERAVALATTLNERILLPYARFNLGYCHFWLGEMAVGLRSMEGAVEAIERLSSADRAEVDRRFFRDEIPRTQDPLSTFVLHLAHVGRYIEAQARGEANLRRYAETARRRAAMAHDPAAAGVCPDDDATRAADTYSGLAQVYAALGQPARARDAYARAKHGYSAANQRTHVGLLAHRELVYAMIPYRADDPPALHHMADAANAIYVKDTSEVPIAAGWAYVHLAYIEGNWPQVLPHLRAFFDTPTVHVGPRLLTIDIFNVCRHQGDPAMAWHAVRRVLGGDAPKDFGDCLFTEAISAQRLAAALALDDGALADTRQWLETHDAWLVKSGAALGQSESHALWAQYYQRMGDRDEAHRRAECARTAATPASASATM